MKESKKEITQKDIEQFKSAVARTVKERGAEKNKKTERFIDKIKIGERVRCFVFFGRKDLEGNNANYFEGKIISANLGEEEVRVRIEKEVVEGKETAERIDDDVPVTASPDAIEKLENH